MAITIKQLRAFIAVAELRNFAAAAEQLHLSQPALSLAVKSLEQLAGGQLLARTTRSFALTPEGELFYPVARRLVEDWSRAVDELHQQFSLRSGALSIAAMPSFAGNLMPQALADYSRRYPAIRVTLQDVIAEEVVKLVSTGRVELGITFIPEQTDALSELYIEPLFEDRFVALLPAHHPLALRREISAQQLGDDSYIALQSPSLVSQLIGEQLGKVGLPFNPSYQSHQLTTIGGMVANGLGVSIVPSFSATQMQQLGCACLPLVEPAICCTVGVLYRRRTALSSAAGAMLQTLCDTFKNMPSASINLPYSAANLTDNNPAKLGAEQPALVQSSAEQFRLF